MPHLKSTPDVTIRSSYSPRNRVQIGFDGEVSLTHQSFSEDCDINKIINRYQKSGVLEHVSSSSPTYGDYTTACDYQSSLNVVLVAQDSFMSLPAKVRARFQNDPGEFLDFVSDPKNRNEVKAMGLGSESVQKLNVNNDVFKAAENAADSSAQLPT